VKTRSLVRGILVALPLTIGIATGASAAFISGTLELTAIAIPSPSDELDFSLDTVSFSAAVTTATDDFAPLLSDTITLSFDYGDLANSIPETLFADGAFSFVGLSVDALEQTLGNGDMWLTLSNGTGVVTAAGYDDTPFVWELVASETSNEIYFSATFGAETDGGGGAGAGPHMPEPSSFLLFTLGFAVVRGVQRRR